MFVLKEKNASLKGQRENCPRIRRKGAAEGGLKEEATRARRTRFGMLLNSQSELWTTAVVSKDVQSERAAE